MRLHRAITNFSLIKIEIGPQVGMSTLPSMQLLPDLITVESPNKGHFGTNINSSVLSTI